MHEACAEARRMGFFHAWGIEGPRPSPRPHIRPTGNVTRANDERKVVANMRLKGIFDRTPAIWRVAAAVALIGAMTGAWAGDAIGQRTELSGIPWDPKSLSDSDKMIYGEEDRIDA